MTRALFRTLAALALSLGALLPAAAQTFTGAMSGTWWDSTRDGEGHLVAFEKLGTRNVVTLAYFTYTSDRQATWHVGSADYGPGATSVPIELFAGSGPRFGTAYNAADLRLQSVGVATLEFVSCTQMRLNHPGIPGVALNLTRTVGPLTDAGCSATAPTAAVAGFTGVVSGGWFNATRNGEGQFIMFESAGATSSVFLAYFTYAADGRSSWLVGNALFASGARSVVVPLVTGSGAQFGASFRSQDVTRTPSGSITLQFQDCGAMSFSYTGTGALTANMTRLVGPLNGLACTDGSGPSASDTVLRFLLAQNGLNGNARAGRTLPAIDDPLPQLGKLLFFSKALSSAGDTACASCHHPALGGADGLALPIGTGAVAAGVIGPGRRLPGSGARVGRNANSFFNSGLFDAGLFWDSRIESLAKISTRNGSGSGIRTPDSPLGAADPAAGPNLPAAQARFPVVGGNEMLGNGFSGFTTAAAIRVHLAARIGNYGTGAGQLPASSWLARFRAAFNSPNGSPEELVTFDRIMGAISEYERSATFVDSAFARYVRGDNNAISEQAKQGALLFYRPVGSAGANCVQCHRGDFMTNEQHHALGFPQVGPGMAEGGAIDDFGRGRQTNLADDRYRYRTPSLLNVELTAPYGHAGAYATLEQAVAHYFTPDATSQAVVNGRTWCSIPPFDSDPGCAGSQATVTTNSQAALAKLHADQATSPATSMPVLDPARFGATAIADITAFLRTLTDPCLKDRACYGKWIPRADEAPDGLQLDATNASGTPF